MIKYPGFFHFFKLLIFWFVSQAWWGRKELARGHHSPSSIEGEWLAIDDQKHNILASLGLASYLAANLLEKLETKFCVHYAEVLSVLMCVCVFLWVCGVISQFDLSITKPNYFFVRCQFLSHIPNTSLRCSNQPWWKLNLMMEVNTTKQQTGEIKNRT